MAHRRARRLAYLLRAVGDPAAARGVADLAVADRLGAAGPAVRRGALVGARCCRRRGRRPLAAAAAALAGRRDLGAGLLPERPGPGRRPPAGCAPARAGLAAAARRLLGWAAGFACSARCSAARPTASATCWAAARRPGTLIDRLGGHGGLVDATWPSIVGLLGLVAAAYAVQAVLRLRGDEATGRAEPVLAGPVGRMRWAAGKWWWATGGIALLMAVAGVWGRARLRARTGAPAARIGRLIGAAMAQVPAAWVLAGVAVALGLAPRVAVAAAWTDAGAGRSLVALLGRSSGRPQWVLDVTPFAHVPRLPGGVSRPCR